MGGTKANWADTKGGRAFRRAVERLLLWLFAAVIAAFPALTEAHMWPTWDVESVIRQVNGIGDIRDLFFVVITLSLISITNVIDNCLYRTKDENQWHSLIARCLLVYYLCMVIYATFFFGLLHPGQTLPSSSLSGYSGAINALLITTFLTEIFISISAVEPTLPVPSAST